MRKFNWLVLATMHDGTTQLWRFLCAVDASIAYAHCKGDREYSKVQWVRVLAQDFQKLAA